MEIRPLILISNDDGVSAKGLQTLIQALRPFADLLVVAPDGPRSGASGSITSEYPLRIAKELHEQGLMVYSCSGTPVDCIKLALQELLDCAPDLVIAGINHGDNSSVNVHYSGTMGAVIEACLKGIPAIGFSLCNYDADADFRPVLPYAIRIVKRTLQERLPYGTCLNVNFPSVNTIKGVRFCRQADGRWVNEFVKIAHPWGKKYYWLAGEYMDSHPEHQDTDYWALQHGYIAITPIQTDMTAYGLLEQIKGWNLD